MPYQVDTVPQRLSNQIGVKDIYYSANVIVNGVSVGLWNTANKSAAYAANLPAGVQVVTIDDSTLNAAIASNGPSQSTTVDGVTIPGAAEMPRSGQAINNSTATDAVNTMPSGVFSNSVSGGGYSKLIENVNTTCREALMANKPWKSLNQGTSNGKSPPATAPNKENIMQCYKDAGSSWIETDGTHWCAAYVTSMLKNSGLPYIKTLSAYDYLQSTNKWTGATWADPKDPNTWRYNDVMVIGGHVCFIRGYDSGTNNLLLAGGNQGQDCNEIVWGGAKYFSQVKSVGRNWPTPPGPLPSTGGGKALTKVATHGGSNS